MTAELTMWVSPFTTLTSLSAAIDKVLDVGWLSPDSVLLRLRVW